MPVNESGTLVIAYRQDGRDHVSGGWFGRDIPGLLQAMVDECGCTIIRVYDGIAEAKARFPVGTRVVARRKWWKSQVGTVVTDAEVDAARLDNCHANGWGWDNVPVRFDGDEGVLGWWASGLEVVAPARACGA